jgi:DNA-binding NtrC family response regulator
VPLPEAFLRDIARSVAGPPTGLAPGCQGGVDSAQAAASPTTTDLNTVERRTIQQVLREARGNKAEAARRLGITRIQLYTRLRKQGLDASLDAPADS